MINYFFKYLELFDTVFLALKKKPMREFAVFPFCFPHLMCSHNRVPPCVSPLGNGFAMLHSA